MKKQHEPVDYDKVFQQLNTELHQKNLTLHLICGGGYVLQRLGVRGTVDVDAFYQSSTEIEHIIQRIGSEFGINPIGSAWLNNAIAAVNDWPEAAYCENVYTFSNLIVDVVTKEYLLGMKLYSHREQDMKDAASVLKMMGVDDPMKVYHLLRGMSFDISILSIIEAFAILYGNDWSSNYYKANSADIIRLLK
jgi:hypothetical protein